MRLLEDLRLLGRLGAMRLRATARRRLRELGSPRGLLFALAIVAFVLWIRLAFGADDMLVGAERELAGLPLPRALALGMLGGVLLTLLVGSGPALHFGAAEMNLLFTAPLGRSALVVGKSVSYAVGATLSALLLLVLVPGVAADGAAGAARFLVATVLALALVQFASAAIGMGGTLLARRLPLPGRTGWLLLLALGGAVPVLVAALGGPSLAETAASLGAAPALAWPLAPFELVAGLYGPAPDATAWVGRALAALALVCALVALIVRLDRHLLAESVAASLAAQRRWQRMLAGASPWRRRAARARSGRPPARPFGIAPIAWWQWRRLLRTAPHLLYGLGTLALVAGAFIGARWRELPLDLVAALVFSVFAFLLPRMLLYDFRGDPDSVERLRALPLSAWRVAAGQLAAPVLVSTTLVWLLLFGALPFVDAGARLLLVALALAAPPLACLIHATDNVGFLLAPARLVPMGRMDFDFLGRTLIDFLARCAVIALAAGLALAAAVAVRTLWPATVLAPLAAALAALYLAATAAAAAVAIAWRRGAGAARRR